MKRTILIATTPKVFSILEDIVKERNDASVECRLGFEIADLDELKTSEACIIWLNIDGTSLLRSGKVKELSDHGIQFHAISTLPFFFEGAYAIRAAFHENELLAETAVSLSVLDYESLFRRCKQETMKKVLEYADKQIKTLVEEVIDATDEKRFAFERKGREILQEYKKRLFEERWSDVLFSLGRIYEEGDGISQDLSQAFEYYRQAAELELSAAQFDLGCLYEYGEGTVQDYTEAFKWYEQAANGKYRDAYCALAQMYEEGMGVIKDINKAFHWYKVAADEKVPYGMYKLACMYRDGEGTERNELRYRTLMYDAASIGYKEAREELRRIFASEIDGLRPRLP